MVISEEGKLSKKHIPEKEVKEQLDETEPEVKTTIRLLLKTAFSSFFFRMKMIGLSVLTLSIL